jgi:hypothetical protein
MVMKTNHHRISTRRCAHCGQPFDVNPRIGRRQRYCSKPNCVRASRRASQKKWLKQLANRDHFKGRENVDRVRDWRKAHPAYWQKKGRLPGLNIKKEMASILREVALQDSIDTHLALLIGLISHLSNLALQDTIAFEIRRLMLLGHGILQESNDGDSSRSRLAAGGYRSSED